MLDGAAWVGAAGLSPLVESLPTHGAELVEPTRWPVQPSPVTTEPSRPAPNRTASESIATLPS